MKIVLYYAPITCALVPFITLTEANADFETRPINMRKKQQMSPDYLKLNPKHKVPVLVVDGKPLTENIAIQLWIARTFPKANLLPADSWQEAKAISMLSWCASGMHPPLSRINSPAKTCDTLGAEASVRALAQKELFESFSLIDGMLAGRDYFFGHFTTADAHFFWCFRRAVLFDLELKTFPNCVAHLERMKQRASVQKLLTFEKSVQTDFAKVA